MNQTHNIIILYTLLKKRQPKDRITFRLCSGGVRSDMPCLINEYVMLCYGVFYKQLFVRTFFMSEVSFPHLGLLSV